MSPILSFFGGSRATSVFARNSHGARGLRASVPVEGTEERETLGRDVLSAAEEEGGKKHSIDSRSLPSLDLPLASLPRPPFGLPSSTSTEKKKKKNSPSQHHPLHVRRRAHRRGAHPGSPGPRGRGPDRRHGGAARRRKRGLKTRREEEKRNSLKNHLLFLVFLIIFPLL